MTTDSQYDARWRQGHVQNRYPDARQLPPTPDESAIALKAPSATHSYPGSWKDGYVAHDQRYDAQRLSAVAGSYADASYHPPRPDQRHTPPSGTTTATSPPGQRIAGSWQSLPLSPHAHQNHISSAPLTVQIPETQDLPRIASDKHSYLHTPLSRQQTATSLPPFSSLQEHANRTDEPDEVEIAPMSARLSCYQCTKLEPLVREAAVAVAELDELVQTSCRDTVTRTLDIPTRDGAVSIVQWMLGRLAKAKGDLQQAAAWSAGPHHASHAPHSYSGLTYHEASPPNSLKRPAWGQEDVPTAKRHRPGTFVDDGHRTLSSSGPKDERRASTDFNADSPLPVESVSGSGFARPGSPAASSRYPRPFPSPSSLAYPLSAAPSALPQAAQSLNSPALSYQPPASVHTTSTSSATSAHLKDLQHQVSLKTMAYDTLQSEYTSLLQKLQRERIKSQTIEKKTTVADQEVNDLTSRNEELTELVKNLETQLEASERKREEDRSQATREKEQWQQMLDLASRIQNKHAEEKQKLRGELESIVQRGTSPGSIASSGVREPFQDPSSSLALVPMTSSTSAENLSMQHAHSRENYAGINPTYSGDTLSVRRQIDALNSRIEILTFALEETRRHNHLLTEQGNEFMNRSEQIRTIVQRALDDGSAPAGINSSTERHRLPIAHNDAPSIQQNAGKDPLSSATVTAGSSESALTPSRDDSRKVSHSAVPASSSHSLASITRAVSPGPAELGFHVTPSTSSPEEIVQALGPAPAPIPNLQNFGAAFEASKPPPPKKKAASSAKRTKQSRRQSVDVINSWMLPPRMPEHPSPQDPNIATQLGSFRPLSANHHHALPSLHSTKNHAGPGLQQPGRSPPSHRSSPGPQRDGTSPSGSAGSVGDTGLEKIQLPSLSQIHRALEHGTVMPPPPRPAVAASGSYGVERE